MARRKRKDDEPDWTPPDFDEVGYMRTEIQAARVAVLTIAWAVVGAFVSYLLSSNPAAAFVAGIAVAFGLYFVLPLIGIDIKPFKRKDWMAHGITYFFSWLAFWILLLNPPFGDFTDPTILPQWISAGSYPASNPPPPPIPCFPLTGSSIRVGTNDTILLVFRATDNVGLSKLTVELGTGPSKTFLTPTLVAGRTSECKDQAIYPGGTYRATFTPAGSSSYHVTITAADLTGRMAAVGFDILPQ
ncbi:MAG: hypothetical protein E6K19_00295 [Methanobacteriota archaeon]|nr:MAG: hypothetical protein E6K19_00295 [Euryarchaeota archaeon]